MCVENTKQIYTYLLQISYVARINNPVEPICLGVGDKTSVGTGLIFTIKQR